MAAIIGMSAEEIFSLCSEAAPSGIVVPANYNSPDQIVISGENQAVEKAVELAKQKGKKGILLKVGGAFHSPLMQNAKVELLPELDKLKFNAASVPVVANVTGKAITKPEHIKELLVEQITKPVLWSQSLEFMSNHGIKNYVEIGPGKVLQGLVQKSLGGVKISGMDKLADIESYLPARK
jgi:[acyl-carrier-protein] S-malonyltransferase